MSAIPVTGAFTCSPLTAAYTSPGCWYDSTNSYTWHSNGVKDEPKKKRKNPHITSSYKPSIQRIIGNPKPKKESFKKASQVVICRV